MRINSRMEPLWRDSQLLELASLPEDTREILASGWRFGPARALLLAGLYGAGWRTDWAEGNVSQHELEVNDLFISAEGLPEDRTHFLGGLVSRAKTTAYAALEAACGLDFAELLTAVISIGVDDDFLSHGATVKLFTRRGEYPRSFEDLEKFQLEAMAVIEADDIGCR